MIEELSEEFGNGNLTEPSHKDRDERDPAIDMPEAREALPEDLRSIAEDLRETPLVEVARQRGCRWEVMRRKARYIHRHFAGRGLYEYISVHQNGEASRK